MLSFSFHFWKNVDKVALSWDSASSNAFQFFVKCEIATGRSFVYTNFFAMVVEKSRYVDVEEKKSQYRFLVETISLAL